MQFSPAVNLKAVGAVRFLHAHGNVCFHFLKQSGAQVSAGDVLALSAGKGTVVYGKHHGNGGLVYVYKGQRLNAVYGAQRFPYVHVGNAVYGHNVAHGAAVAFFALQAVKGVQAGHLGGGKLVVAVAYHYLLTVENFASVHLAYAYSAHVLVVVYVANKQLQAALNVPFGTGYFLQNGVQQRFHICAVLKGIRSPALLCRSVYDFEIELLVGGAQFHKQFHYLLLQLHLVKFALVHFVYDDKSLFAQSQRFFKHVSCLGHAALYGVHQQQHAVYHGQNAFHFAAEIGMPRGVDDVYFYSVVVHGGVFCKYGYAPFPFDVVAVHNSFGNYFVGTEYTALFEQLIHKGGFAVVYVRYDGYVSYVFSFHTVSEIQP